MEGGTGLCWSARFPVPCVQLVCVPMQYGALVPSTFVNMGTARSGNPPAIATPRQHPSGATPTGHWQATPQWCDHPGSIPCCAHQRPPIMMGHHTACSTPHAGPPAPDVNGPRNTTLQRQAANTSQHAARNTRLATRGGSQLEHPNTPSRYIHGCHGKRHGTE
jgi:hypothetical protein